MKLTPSTRNKFFLHLAQGEKQLLFELLKLYPRTPPAHYKLSKAARLPDQEASQQLLDEALEEQRTQNKKQVEELLTDPLRLRETETGCRIALSRGDVEWLLQVLNDIRVGSWILLGSPEPKLEINLLTEKTAPDFWAMELAGQIQMHLLSDLNPR